MALFPVPALFEPGLKLGDHLQVLPPSGGALELHESPRSHDMTREPERLYIPGERQKVFMGAAARHLTRRVDIAVGRRQREAPDRANREDLPPERQARRGTAKIGLSRP